MSDSRLEKFIYAICSMDVSDLPVPLSRIEKLWNCLITGETPDFEPLSRNEKYLMAMLDRYDISNLPAPMSRGEKLLYKIAVGETDLSDVPGYLSRYEELLKYLIENGEISEDDFEYVLYTLNQSLYTLYTTAEKPVKSAILKGNTLVNLSVNKGYTTVAFTTTQTYKAAFQYNIESYKPNTKYLVITEFNHDYKYNFGVNIPHVSSIFNENILIENGVGRVYKHILTTKSDFTGCNTALRTVVYNNTEETDFSQTFRIMIIEYQEGMENWDIPYFEGMQSVKMPVLTTTNGSANILTDSQLNDKTGEIEPHNNSNKVIEDYILIPNNPVIVSNVTWLKISFYDANKVYISNTGNTNINKFELNDTTIPANAKYFRFHYNTVNLPLIRFVNGTDYIKATIGGEPFKSNILTVNEDVELRGIGEVQDTLDLMTGELTQRVSGLECIDQNSKLSQSGTSNDTTLVVTTSIKSTSTSGKRGLVSSHELIKYAQLDNWFSSVSIIFRLPKANENFATLTAFKQFLTQNPFYYYRELEKEEISIKTVDLTVVDQDNQPTELGTFENVTHVSLEAEGLIPEVEMEVATNLLEDTVFNLTNAFNTLYPTAAKPVVDGTLYGQTLLSVSNYTFLTGKYLDINNGTLIDGSTNHRYIEDYFVIPEGTQVITLKGVNNYKKICYYDGNKQFIIGYNLSTKNPDDFTTDVPTGASYFRFNTSLTEILGSSIVVDEYLHVYVDDYLYLTNKPDYIEGAKLISCKIPDLTIVGKNLINNTSWESGRINNTTGEVLDDANFMRYTKYIQVKPSTTYVWKNNVSNEYKAIYEYGASKEYIGLYNNTAFINQAVEFTTSATTNFIKIWVKNTTVSSTNQLEEGSIATTYEPYKSTTLSTPSDLELRKVGEVQDELNLLTGEVVERIGEIVLDGTQSSVKYNSEYSNDDYYCFIYDITKNGYKKAPSSPIGLSCYISYQQNKMFPWTTAKEFVLISGNELVVKLLKSRLSNDNSISTLNTYLASHPITINYPLETESVKTVDLSVVDQDGNATTLKTFDDTTHVLLNSEGLIPTAVLTVRTKIPSGSSTSLLMDDISTEQQQLETTVDKQSNNVDATMIATTEIYEGTL